ncbi:MAG: TolC family protein [Verrucomicrobiales bacterium]|nr:TolC family protein [Verrucomicrobiales bacterium]
MTRLVFILMHLCLAAVSFADGKVVLTLEQAYDRALATDQSIRQAFYELKKADLLPSSALARLGPSITGNAGLTQGRDQRSTSGASTTTPLGRASVQETSSVRTARGTADLTWQQPLLDFSVFPAHRFGKLSIAAAEWQQRFTIRETLFGVAQSYYEVLKQQRLVAVNRESLQLSNEQLAVSEKRAAAGEVTRSDVLRTQVVVETARRTLVESEATLAINEDTLRNALNFGPQVELSLLEPPDAPVGLPEFADLLQRAKVSREDLKVRSLAIEQEMEKRHEIKAQYLPRIVAQVNGGYTDDSGTTKASNEYWSAEIGVQVPLFTGGQREIDLKNARYLIEQSRLEKVQLEKTVEAEVRQAWLDVRRLRETVKALQVQVRAAEQSYRDLQNQYKAGTATSVDVLSALSQLNVSRQDLSAETYDYQVALRSLDRVAGVFQEARVQRTKLR